MYRVIVVEDESLIRKWIVSYITNYCNEVIVVGSASNGEKGAKLIEELKPDIVLTDLSMPVMDAFSMFKLTSDIPYIKIVLSAYNDFKNAKKAIYFKVFEFIAKPIDKKELSDVIKRATDFIKSEQENISKKLLNLPSAGVSDETVKSALNYINDHIYEVFKVGEVASYVGVSESYLYKLFKDETGLSVNEFINKTKVNKAIDMLYENPNLKVYEISLKLGFSDEKYFSKLFKKYAEMSIKEMKSKIKVE